LNAESRTVPDWRGPCAFCIVSTHDQRPAGSSDRSPGAQTFMSRDLERTISMRDLALLVIGNVIGSGIFIVPATVLAQVDGDVGTAQLVWLVGGVLSLLGALTYGELAAMRPEAGGLYVFARDAFGPFVAFLFGWTLLLAIGAGTVAALGAAFANVGLGFELLRDDSPNDERVVDDKHANPCHS
jgi:amino acid permease